MTDNLKSYPAHAKLKTGNAGSYWEQIRDEFNSLLADKTQSQELIAELCEAVSKAHQYLENKDQWGKYDAHLSEYFETILEKAKLHLKQQEQE